MKKIIFLYLLITSSIFVSCVFADDSEIDGAPAYNGFSQMRGKISNLMSQNKQLETEYALLSQEAQSLQEAIAASESRLKDLGYEMESYNSRQQQIQDKTTDAQDHVLSLQNEIMLQQGKTVYLKKQSFDLEEKISSLQNEIDGYNGQAKSLNSKIAQQQQHISESLQAQSKEIDALKAKQKSLEDQYKLSLQGITKLNDDGQENNAKIDELIKGNNELDLAIEKTKADLDIKQKESDILRQKRTLATRSLQVELQDKRDEKAALADEVSALEEKYKNLDQNVNQSLSWQTNKKDMVENIIRLDKENQGLREKITTLQGEIDSLK